MSILSLAWWGVPVAAACATLLTWLITDIRRQNRENAAWIASLRSERVYDGPLALMDAILDVLPGDVPVSRPVLYSVPVEAERASLRIVGDAIDETLKDAS